MIKKPGRNFNPPIAKQPRSEPPKNYSVFTWSFAMLDREGPYGWSALKDPDKYLEILVKKGSLETFEISRLHYQGSHSVTIDKISKGARQRLIEIKKDDIDALFSMRITGPNRIWCIRQENIMRVLWWDPKHEICPSLK